MHGPQFVVNETHVKDRRLNDLCIWELMISTCDDDDDDDDNKLCSPALTAKNSHERADDTICK